MYNRGIHETEISGTDTMSGLKLLGQIGKGIVKEKSNVYSGFFRKGFFCIQEYHVIFTDKKD